MSWCATWADNRLLAERAWLIGVILSRRAHPLAAASSTALLDDIDDELAQRRKARQAARWT